MRVNTWREGSVDRMLLERDVWVTLGGHRFIADRALVWIGRDPSGVTGAAEADRQVAIYFENVRDPGGPSAVSQRADRLLVTARVGGEAPSLRADILSRTPPTGGDPFIADGEARLARYLDEVRGITPPPLTPRPAPAGPQPTEQPPDEPAQTDHAPDTPPPSPPAPISPDQPIDWTSITIPEGLRAPARPDLPPADRSPISREGVVMVSSPGEVRRVVRDDGATDAVVMPGGLTVQYQSPTLNQNIELSAGGGVVFFANGAADAGALRAEDVAGVYLEGDVRIISPGYSLRASRAYYDIKRERAVLIDAVFWTFDADKGMPLYLRAAEVRQESATQWSANDVVLTNVAFADPHFSIGADSLTLSGTPVPQGEGGAGAGAGGIASAGMGGGALQNVTVEGSNISFLMGRLPVLRAGKASGEIRPSPLRRIDVGSEKGDPVVRTQWDLNALFGVDAGPGNSAVLLADGWFDRGPGVGTEVDWNSGEIDGSLYAYYLRDSGTDQLTSGAEIDQDDEDRYLIEGEQQWRLNRRWSIFADLAMVSDETFIDALYEEQAETRREFSSAIWARRLEAQEAVYLEARGMLMDSIPNEYLLQSLGYQTQKIPELSMYTLGRDFLAGLITYYGEMRAGLLDLQFSDPSMRKLGFNTVERARAAAGLLPNQSIADSLDAAGVPDGSVARFDTRHEFEAPLSSGPINVVPFAVGRVTAYDNDFDEFGDADQNHRFWGSVGARAGTSFVRVYEGARSRLLNLDGIRHIIEPTVTAWTAATDVDQQDLPIFDDDVESLADGSLIRFGLRNTLQTRRGPDRSPIDWLVLDTDIVWSSDEIDRESPFFTFLDSRPESGLIGEFFDLRAALRVTDALALVGQHQRSLDDGMATRSSIGAELDHGAGFRSYFEYHELDPIDSQFLIGGAAYELTRKDAIGTDVRYDLDEAEVQDAAVAWVRRFPQWTMRLGAGWDGISEDFTIGISFRLVGAAGEGRTRHFTQNSDIYSTPVIDTPQPGGFD